MFEKYFFVKASVQAAQHQFLYCCLLTVISIVLVDVARTEAISDFISIVIMLSASNINCSADTDKAVAEQIVITVQVARAANFFVNFIIFSFSERGENRAVNPDVNCSMSYVCV